MKDKYKLGIDIIDEQHQKIFDLIEKLCKNIDENGLEIIINELKEYSIYHFDTEEKYFNNINFKLAVEHTQLHNIFIETIDYYYENFEKLNKKKLYTFLQTWIKKHILIEDKKYTLKENIE